MTDGPEPFATREDVLREQLRVLAEKSGLPVPPLDVEPDPKGRKVPAHVTKEPGEPERIQVTERLLEATAAEQDWYLAAFLGWWASPEARRRRWRARAVISLVVLPCLGLGFADVVGLVELPEVLLFVGGPVLGAAMQLTIAAVSRWQFGALDAVGHDVLRAAGRDPATVAREAFGGRPDPSWFQRLHAIEPVPSERIAAAERRRAEPDRPLF